MINCVMPETVKITTQLYRPGMVFMHQASASVMLLTQDSNNPKNYYLITLLNRATPSQNFTGTAIRGSRDDGLLSYEIEAHIFECQPLDKLDINFPGWANF